MNDIITDALIAAQTELRYLIEWDSTEDGITSHTSVVKPTMFDACVHYRWTRNYDLTATNFTVYMIINRDERHDITEQFLQEVSNSKLWTYGDMMDSIGGISVTQAAIHQFIKQKLEPEIDYFGNSDRFRIYSQSGYDKIKAQYGKK